MDIYPPGTYVSLNNHKALVISVHLYPNKRITYTVAYWKDGTRTELTVESCEIRKHDESYTRAIGFITLPPGESV